MTPRIVSLPQDDHRVAPPESNHAFELCFGTGKDDDDASEIVSAKAEAEKVGVSSGDRGFDHVGREGTRDRDADLGVRPDVSDGTLRSHFE
jgi:hypothetical protein